MNNVKSPKRITVKVTCHYCGRTFEARKTEVLRGFGRYCSRSCSGKVGSNVTNSQDHTGPNNPNWKGGISKNFYHYRKIQSQRYPERNRARQRVCYAIKTGKLERQPCEICGEIKTHAHHDDYSRPLDVRWLCTQHHRELHAGLHE